MANKKDSNVQKNQNVDSTEITEEEISKDNVEDNIQENVKEKNDEGINKSNKKAKFNIKDFYNKNKMLVLIVGAVLIAIILFLIIFSIISSNGSKNIEKPLVYVNSDGELKYITSKEKKPITITSIDENPDIKYSNMSDRYILYTKDDNLYLFDTQLKKESERITTDVDDFGFSKNDKYIIFTNDDDDLYVYYGANKTKLDAEISYIVGVSNDKIFYKKDGNLYMNSLDTSKDEKVKITSDYASATFNEDLTKVLYSKKVDDDSYLRDYYVYDIKSGKNDLAISNVNNLYDYSDDFKKFIYSSKSENDTFDISKIIEDDKLEEDKNFKAYTYRDYLDAVVDYETYRNSYNEQINVNSRNRIRERLNEEYSTSSVKVYYQVGDNKTELAKDVDSVIETNIDSGAIVYTTLSYNTDKKLKMSEINYFYEITDFLKECEVKSLMFKIGENDAVQIKNNIDKTIDSYIIKNDLYYVIDEELFYAKIEGNKLGEVISLAENVEIIDSTGDYQDSLIFVKDVNDKSYGDLMIAKSGKSEKIAQDVYSSGINVTETNRIYYYTNYSNRSGDYNVYNGKANKILEDINSIYYVNDNYMYVLKNYSYSSDTADLYRYRGNKLDLIEYNIEV
ncbi:MAG: hypothetical protein NC181_03765 [Clostridium sp.]|nr:hypothetical protein [Clostridium sp.]MCM1444262.1 hypothetical protein [Candidatus Amulumruptor caecigallinarius]